MIGIGVVGLGFMGMIHYLAAQRTKSAKVKAVCSRDARRRAGDWTAIQGNFGPRGAQMNLEGVSAYAAFDDLLKDPEVQLVDLCTPNKMHAPMAVAALEAGKHVLVEKPIALSIAEADSMLAAAKTSGKLLMVAHVLPFFPEFAYARKVVESGDYGKILAAHFTRVISKPDWSAGISDFEQSGGPAIDLHIHDAHYISLLCGVPKAVHSRGVLENGAVLHLTTQYFYDDASLAVSAVSGALSQPARPFAQGFEIWLEQGTLTFEFATLAGAAHVATPLSLLLPDGSMERPELGSGDPLDAFADEIAEAVQAVERGVEAASLSGLLARQALGLCLAEIESVQTCKTVAVG